MDSEKSRRKGLYLRCITGVKKAEMMNKRVTFLTLTTNSVNGDGLSDEDKMYLVSRDWHVMSVYLKQLFGKFEHLAVVTNEAYGVIHVVIVGLGFVYFGRIWRLWNQCHGMGFVWINRVRGSPDGIANYLMSQYMANQKCLFRFKMSHDFICKKFSKYWRLVRRCSMDYDNMMTKRLESGYEVHYWPVIYEKLVKNWDKWMGYYIQTGGCLEYV